MKHGIKSSGREISLTVAILLPGWRYGCYGGEEEPGLSNQELAIEHRDAEIRGGGEHYSHLIYVINKLLIIIMNN